MDQEYIPSQYRIARKYLNTISGPQLVKSARGMIVEVKRKEYIVALARALQAHGFRPEVW